MGTVWFRITIQNRPRYTSSPASVTMKAGMRSRTMSQPFNCQITTPAPSAISSATGAGRSCRATSTVATPLTSAAPLPTERSMCPGRMMSSMPIASVAVIASSVIRRDKLRALTNCGSTTAKKPHTATRVMARAKSRSVSRLFMGGEIRVAMPRGANRRPGMKAKNRESAITGCREERLRRRRGSRPL